VIRPGFAWGVVLGIHRGMGNRGATIFRNLLTAAALAAAAGFPVPASTAAAPASATPVTCINPVSGASWQIMIDYGEATVDANPAKISRTEITWFDPRDGGRYTLDRTSGDLTASAASSTGGYFRHDRCRLEQSR
jgi:hypothetical protein